MQLRAFMPRTLALATALATLVVCATALAQDSLPPAASEVFSKGGFGAVAVVALLACWMLWRDNRALRDSIAKLTSDGQGMALQNVQAVTKIDETLRTLNTTMIGVGQELRALADRVRKP